ncbi:ribonuclease H-like domain-containing protein [Cytidiella melzeri]|nr:ribonuclease H-like domain-containing protein [Cytidiella melzeri]
MVKVADKYNTNLAAIKVSSRLKNNLPIWHHIGAKEPLRRLIHSASGQCLLNTHGVFTVGNLLGVLKRTRPDSPHHTGRPACSCQMCTLDRERLGCTHPSKCCETASRLLNNLHAKWHPAVTPPDNKLTLTRHRKEKNRKARIEGSSLTFNPSVTDGDNVADGFRIFTDPAMSSCEPAHCPPTPAIRRSDVLTVYTDGSCLNNGAANARAGAGVWYGTGDPRNLAIRVPRATQTNQAGEVLAIQRVAALTPPSRPLHIISDSRYAIDGLTTHLQKWRDWEWTGVDNADFFQSAAYCNS